MRRFATLVATLGTVVLVSVTGCGPSGDRPQAAPSGPPTGKISTPGAGATTPPPTDSPTTAPPDQPSPSRPGTEPLRRGDSGDAVEAVQQRLHELGYWVGQVDGAYGALTEQAVFAIQKAAGTDPDGVVGPRTREALAEGVRPSASSENGRVVEVDLDRQLMMLVEDGAVERIFNTSTGTFEYYTYDGERYLADTPPGKWEIGWQVDGWDPGPLGRLYRPKYFHSQGIAVHGYPEVPPYPASHGCVRVTIAAMDWLWQADQLPTGTSVWVY
jgi:lipoprotein-anchoring transpeptidase ErfK/SrfK